jgi:hypothetical protein
VTPDANDSNQERQSEFNFAVFAWFLALAVLFQLARGDMGVFPALRHTPNGATFGDGLVPQMWFCCALLTLVYPNRVWSLVLLGTAGVFDLWWRLPTVTPSIYFHGFISMQILLTALYLLARRHGLRISAAEFIDSFRTPVLGLLIALFFFSGFHKLSYGSPAATTGFFRLVAGYYLPFLSTAHLPRIAIWFITVSGELGMAGTLLFQRTRAVALTLCVGFACFVGTVVYGFGAIVLAALMPLIATHLVFEPVNRLGLTDFLRRHMTAKSWRLAFLVAIGAVFLHDHATGFTLADRTWLFGPGEKPKTADVLTLMQLVWFVFSTGIFAAVLVAAIRHRSAIAIRFRPARAWIAYLLPAFVVLSELGLYTGLKDSPNFTMFSGLVVKSCMPNHLIARNHFLSSFFHRDLIFATTSQGKKIGIPALSLRAKLDRTRRHSTPDPLIEIYRDAKVTRMRGGVEEPFDLNDLDNLRASSWLEVLLPRRLFFLEAATEADLRCSMPKLFPVPRSDVKGLAVKGLAGKTIEVPSPYAFPQTAAAKPPLTQR